MVTISKALVTCLAFAQISLLASSTKQEAPPAGTAAPAESVALDTAAAIVHFYKKTGKRVWPGYDLSRQPLLIYVPERWALLLNASNHVEGFAEYPDGWPDLGTSVLLRMGSSETLVGQLVFNLELGDLRTVAVPVFEAHLPANHPSSRLYWFGFTIHEAFH